MRRALVVLVGLALLASCSPGGGKSEKPPADLPAADATATALAKGLASGDVSSAPFVNAASDAQADYKTIMGRMDGLLPSVEVLGLTYDAGAKTAEARLGFKFSIGPKSWDYESVASMSFVDEKWAVAWAPTIVHPDLSPDTRLRHVRTPAKRGSIIGAGGQALMEQREVFQVGIDKANLAQEKWDASAKALAQKVGVDVAEFAAKVAKAGPKAFVVAVTLRSEDIPGDIGTVEGGYLKSVPTALAPTKTFAVGLLGVVGEATAGDIKEGKGLIAQGDIVGRSGLQKRHDASLRGQADHQVSIVERDKQMSSPPPNVDKVLFHVDAVAGKDLEITLDYDLQTKAEETLAGQQGVATLVVVRPGTGEILAAANSPASGQNAYATTGKYAPGSTFKVVTSLALLRSGMTPSSKLSCPSTLTVSGRTFKNYSDYPSSGLGTITLAQAVANSCNTAFAGAGSKLGGDALGAAAKSLGVGQDYDTGFSMFYGDVPASANDPVGRAASMFGQGQVSTSPAAMAGVAASVAGGKTAIPWLVKGSEPSPAGAPLTAEEASALQELMKGVVSGGSARSLSGVVTGAKTGTAEYTEDGQLKTHAWMIAWTPKLAVSVMVYDGVSGSKTAAPVVKDFFGRVG